MLGVKLVFLPRIDFEIFNTVKPLQLAKFLEKAIYIFQNCTRQNGTFGHILLKILLKFQKCNKMQGLSYNNKVTTYFW